MGAWESGDRDPDDTFRRVDRPSLASDLASELGAAAVACDGGCVGFPDVLECDAFPHP